MAFSRITCVLAAASCLTSFVCALAQISLVCALPQECENPPPPYDYIIGGIQNPLPEPYTPAGGANTDNTSVPFYHPLSDFDYESFALGLYQEYIELDLFRYGLKRFSTKEFEDVGLTDADRYLIEFMSDQEVGHARLITNILGPTAPKQCIYQYPDFGTVRDFINFCQALTKWGEAGVYGFLTHLNSRASANLLIQSITTEARQQMIFRQFEGIHAMPVWFEPGIPQSWAWTLLAPYIKSCPRENGKLVWANFPTLYITNNPDPLNPFVRPAISPIHPPLSYAGRKVELSWEGPGKPVGPDNLYKTDTTATGPPKYVLWVSQINATYTELTDVQGFSGSTTQPGDLLYPPEGGISNGTAFAPVADPVVNGTIFIAITDVNLYVTVHNLSLINKHVVAGPAIYYAG